MASDGRCSASAGSFVVILCAALSVTFSSDDDLDKSFGPRMAALAIGFCFAFVSLVGVRTIDWHGVELAGLVTAGLFEIPKLLYRIGHRVDGMMALSFGILTEVLILSVHLTRNTFAPVWAPFAGFVLGLTGSVALFGFRSLIGLALPKRNAIPSATEADNVSELRRTA